jgi:hypothetical protein
MTAELFDIDFEKIKEEKAIKETLAKDIRKKLLSTVTFEKIDYKVSESGRDSKVYCVECQTEYTRYHIEELDVDFWICPICKEIVDYTNMDVFSQLDLIWLLSS